MATVSKDVVLTKLESRYDYQSARNVFNNWRKAAEIKEDLSALGADQLGALADYLEAIGEETIDTADVIRGLVSSEEPKAPEPKVEEPAPVEEPKAEEPKKEEKPKKKKPKKGKKKD